MTDNIVFLIFLYLIEPLIVYSYAKSIFSLKLKQIQTMLISSCSYLFILIIYLFVIRNDIVNLLSILIVNFLQLKFLYNSKVKSAVFHSFLLIIIQFISETSAAYIFSWILNISSNQVVENYFEFGSITSLLIYFTLTKLLSMFATKENRSKLSGKNFVLFLLPVSSVAIVLVLRSLTVDKKLTAFQNVLCIGSMLLLLAANIAMFLVYETSLKNSERLFTLEMAHQKKELDEQYFSILQKSNDDMQILAHDFKNHLSYVRNLDSVEDIDKYIDKVYPEIERFQQTASAGNKTLDVILGKYTSICQMKAVEFKTDIKNANLAQVESVDLIALLNNLLDNAVEAAETSESKRITLTLVKDTQFMDKLVIANSCDTAPAQSGDKLLTRKKKGALHGTGLKSVKKVCDRYGANYTWEYDSEEHLFITTVLMPKEQKSK